MRNPTAPHYEDGLSGPDLIRIALAAAKTPEERRQVERAAGAAARDLMSLLQQRLETKNCSSSNCGLVVAWQQVIWELEALVAGARLTPLPPVARHHYEREIDRARSQSRECVNRHLRRSSTKHRIVSSPGGYAVRGHSCSVEVCGKAQTDA